MRLQGKITRWDDIIGFGFIDWHGDNTSVFVHTKAFTPRSRRPEIGDIVSYQVSKDKSGKKRAEKVRWSERPTRQNQSVRSPRKSVTPVLFTVVFMGTLWSAAYLKRVSWLLVVAYITLSLITFIAYD